MNSIFNHSLHIGGFPDTKRIIRLISRYWYIFTASVLIAYLSVYISLKFTPRIYQGSLTILLESSNDQRITQSEMIEGIVMKESANNIDNQSLIIQSRNTIQKTINRLDFGLSVFSVGRFLDTDLYQETPFRILIDSVAPQMLNTPVYLTFKNDGQIEIRVKAENAFLFDVKKQKTVDQIENVNIEKSISIDEKLSSPFLSFTISKNDGFVLPKDKEFYFTINSNEDVINSYVGTLNVSPLREGSTIITVSTVGQYPKKIKRFLDELSKVYLEQNLDKKNQYANRTLGFIQIQLAQISDSLNITRDKLMRFRAENKFVNPSEFSQKISEEYYMLEKQRIETQYKKHFFEDLKNNLINNPNSDDYLLPAVSDESNPLISTIITELMKLNSELKAKEKYGSVSNPIVSSLEESIEAQRLVVIQLVEKYIVSLNIKINDLNSTIGELTARMDKMPVIERNFMDLERSYKLNDAIYTFLLQKQSETQITKSSNTPDNEIVDSARVFGPISPNARQQTAKALLLSLFIPLLLIIGFDMLRNDIQNSEEIKQLVPELPIIASIPQSKTNDQNVLLNEGNSVIAESFRTARNKIRFLLKQRDQKVISISSSNTGEGKTFFALNIATAFCVSGNRTVLVGFDLRKPRLNQVFEHQSNVGISNYLINQVNLDDIIIPTGIENLSVIPSGVIPPNPAELIESDRTKELFKELRARYDIVIVDTPPIGVVSDARLLIEESDCLLFVIREHYSRKDQVSHVLHSLIQENVKGIGIVYNNIALKSKAYGYGYYS